MDQEYLLNDMVRFLYREMSAAEAVELTMKIDADDNLRSIFFEMLTSKLQLPKVMFDPAPNTINKILEFSTNSALEAHL